MKIALIVAKDKDNGIAKNGEIPWYLPKDLSHFKYTTLNHYVVFGRRTWISIGKPLRNRRIIVVTRNPSNFRPIVNPDYIDISLSDAIQRARLAGEKELFIGGGSDLYQAAIGVADVLYVTSVHKSFDCDKFFPAIQMQDWTVVEETFNAEKEIEFTISKLERKH